MSLKYEPSTQSKYDWDVLAARSVWAFGPDVNGPYPETRNPEQETRNPTRNPKPETRNPKPETRNPKP